MESRPRWMSACAGSSSSRSASARRARRRREELTTEVHRPEEAVAPGSLEPAAAEAEASWLRRTRPAATRAGGGGGGVLARADAAAEAGGGDAADATRAAVRGCAGCADADADADAAVATARGRRRAAEAPRGAPRAGGWRGGIPRRRGVLGAPGTRDRSGRRRRARAETARGRADGRRDGERRRGRGEGHHLVAQPTRADTCLREGGWTREGDGAASEDAAGRSTLAFRCLPKGETCSSCDPPRGTPGKEWRPRRRQCDYRYREISRAGPTRQVLLSSWWQRLRRMSRIFLGPGESREPLNSRMTVCFASIADRGSPTGFRTVM